MRGRLETQAAFIALLSSSPRRFLHDARSFVRLVFINGEMGPSTATMFGLAGGASPKWPLLEPQIRRAPRALVRRNWHRVEPNSLGRLYVNRLHVARRSKLAGYFESQPRSSKTASYKSLMAIASRSILASSIGEGLLSRYLERAWYHARESSDKPRLNAFWRVAPSVRFNVRAMLDARVRLLATRHSSISLLVASTSCWFFLRSSSRSRSF
jgi:hypothetical protein